MRTVNYDREPAGRRASSDLPELGDADFEALRARIRLATTGRAGGDRAVADRAVTDRPASDCPASGRAAGNCASGDCAAAGGPSVRRLPDGRPDGRPIRPIRRVLRAAVPAAAAALLVAGLFVVAAHREAPHERELDELLATASAETVARAAAENYDDILYDPQL